MEAAFFLPFIKEICRSTSFRCWRGVKRLRFIGLGLRVFWMETTSNRSYTEHWMGQWSSFMPMVVSKKLAVPPLVFTASCKNGDTMLLRMGSNKYNR
jgi:hypothetical protein